MQDDEALVSTARWDEVTYLGVLVIYHICGGPCDLHP